MTAVADPVLDEARVEVPPARTPVQPRTRRAWWPPLTMLGVVLAGVIAPVLRVPTFYYWDDTAAASVGGWRTIGAAVLHGHLPLLDLEMWRGGNFAAEAGYGMYNPLLLGLSAATMPIDDLAVVTDVIKGFFFLTMALGAYLVCREYGARPWAAAVAGTMLPLSGYTLWMDGAAWVTGLTVTAMTPWVWYTAKRAAEGRGSLLWLIGAAYLCGSAGNPYGLLSTAFVIAAVVVEALLRRRPRRAAGIAVAGVVVGLLCVATYLPFELSSTVSYRTGSRTLNDEYLSPGLSELLGLSSPSFQPYMRAFSTPYWTFPVAYLGWFVLPLAPWLRWSLLRRRARELSAAFVFGAVYLLLVLGPSQVWFFRWPMRLLPYLWLPVAVLFAVLLSAGLNRSRPRLRWALSATAIAAGFYLAASDRPGIWHEHVEATVVVAGLLWLLLRVARRSGRGLALVAMGGSLLVLLMQLHWYPTNANTSDYNFPRSQAALERQYAGYGPGVTVQLADKFGPLATRNADGIYHNILFGSMYSVAGVESLTAYSGIGFNPNDQVLCMYYAGSTCKEAWDALFTPPKGSSTVLADLVRAQTVVVQRSLIDTRHLTPPPGWQLTESTQFADIWRRTATVPWQQGRLSDISGPVTVRTDQRTGSVGETLTFDRTGAGAATLTFARLDWPGYTAAVDGRPVPVTQGPAGLVSVRLPEGVRAGTLTLDWAPPGEHVSIAAAGLAALVTLALAVLEFRRRRTGRTARAAISEVPS